ncbi:MAG: hypothetical protein E7356_01295 [Clostridiales bacterium]|nr:hypothetical protein [Clostridiales bacterium]
MKRLLKSILCGVMLAITIIGVSGRIDINANASNSTHTVTFDFSKDRVLKYINSTSEILESLRSYTLTTPHNQIIEDSLIRVPHNTISRYYTYYWTYNGTRVDLGNFVINRDVKFVAEWVPRDNTAYFIFENEEVATEVTNRVDTLKFNIESGRIELYRPIRQHYIFAGWYKPDSKIEETYIPAGTEGDKVYYAKFRPINYYINYNTNATISNPTSYTVEDEDIILYDPVAEGHIFHGWYSDSGCTNPIDKIDTSVGGNISIYPLWELEKYAVTYTLPNGTKAVVMTEYGKKAELPRLEGKSIFSIVKTDVSRDNITRETSITIRYVNIWYVYVLGILVIAGIVVGIILAIRKRRNTHNTLRSYYQSSMARRGRR